MGRIISTSSTNTRHKHKQKTSEHTHITTNNNTSSKQSEYIMNIVVVTSGLPIYDVDDLPSGNGPVQHVVHGRKLAFIPLADIADIGLRVQRILNPAIGFVSAQDIKALATTLQKYLPFPIVSYNETHGKRDISDQGGKVWQ